MEYVEFRPPGALARHVRCFWSLRGASPLNPMFPDGRMELVFHLGAPVVLVADGRRQPDSMIVGQMRGPVLVHAPAGAIDVFGIRFQPAAARCLLPFEASRLAGNFFNVEDLDRAEYCSIRRRLGDEPSPPGRARIAARWLLRRLASDPDPFAEHWAAQILRGDNEHAGALSSRQARRRFASAVGAGPKLFARIARFQRTLALVQRLPLAFAAADAGYADQAHLNREFREFSGMTPGEWLRQNGRFLQDSSLRFEHTGIYETRDPLNGWTGRVRGG